MWVLPLLVTIVATAEVKGVAEPCGCSSNPLGDVARVATLAKGGLWLDGGSLSYDHEAMAPARLPQADATAAELGRIYTQAGAEVGLGSDDLARGPGHVTPARQACNLRGLSTAAPRVRLVDGVRVGVFGVAQPARLRGVRASEPVAAARRAVATLRRQGAAVVVALCAMDRQETRALARAVPGIDFAVVGADVGDGMIEPESAGDGFIVAPADLARYAVKLTLAVRAPGKLQLYAGEAERKRQRDKADKRIATLKEQLGVWQKDPTAEASFVAARQEELTELERQRRELDHEAPPPPTGSWFSYELVPMSRKIPRDPKVADQLQQLARAIGRVNLQAAQGEAPPPAEPGAPSFVGTAACAKCHKSAVEFWKHTVHAQAWKTLVDVDKQYNYDCIGCHVTGWQRAGGINLVTVEKRGLVDVQCEVCHGPGSQHVADAGLEETRTLVRRPADRFCADNCHTHEHSDTFSLVPYLRDILGKGHGAEARARLGEGVTGHELRQQALQAAGR
jgi:hypothetical protein